MRVAWLFFSSCFFILLISFSRSFWLGLGVGLAAWLIVLIKSHTPVRILSQFVLVLALSGITAGAMAQLVASSAGNVTTERLLHLNGEAAFDSRKNQLEPLWAAIQEAPFFGQGFGTALSYESRDPRHPGLYTTSAFELGYLDMLLKFGLAGLAIFLYFIWQLWYGQGSGRWVRLPALIAILVVHGVSAYLNHPLGLGYLYLWTFWQYG